MQGHDCDLIRISLSFWHYIVTIEHLETQRDPARNYCGCRTRVAASRASKPSPYPISKIIDIPDFPKSRMESGWESTVIDSSDSRKLAPAFRGHSLSLIHFRKLFEQFGCARRNVLSQSVQDWLRAKGDSLSQIEKSRFPAIIWILALREGESGRDIWVSWWRGDPSLSIAVRRSWWNPFFRELSSIICEKSMYTKSGVKSKSQISDFRSSVRHICSRMTLVLVPYARKWCGGSKSWIWDFRFSDFFQRIFDFFFAILHLHFSIPFCHSPTLSPPAYLGGGERETQTERKHKKVLATQNFPKRMSRCSRSGNSVSWHGKIKRC